MKIVLKILNQTVLFASSGTSKRIQKFLNNYNIEMNNSAMRLWSLSQRNFSSSKSHHKRPPKHNPYARARDREEPPQMKRKRGLKRLRFELRRTVTQIKSQLIPSLTPYKSFSFIGRTIILGLLALYMFRYLQRSQSLIREFKVEDTGRPNFSHTLGLEKKVDDILKKNRGD